MRYVLLVLFALVSAPSMAAVPFNQTVGFYYQSCHAADAEIYAGVPDHKGQGKPCIHFFGGAAWAAAVVDRSCLPAEQIGDLMRMFMVWAAAQPERHQEHIVNALSEILRCPTRSIQ